MYKIFRISSYTRIYISFVQQKKKKLFFFHNKTTKITRQVSAMHTIKPKKSLIKTWQTKGS